MARGGVDVGEGEISNGRDASDATRREWGNSGGSRGSGQRYREGRWVPEYLKFPAAPKYKPELYNFAWAQAVQSRPADGVVVKDIKSDYEKWVSSLILDRQDGKKRDDNEKLGDTEKRSVDADIDESQKDFEKEEGEIEEGEIGIGDAPDDSTVISLTAESSPEGLQSECSNRELDNVLLSIQTSLKELAVKDPTKSFLDWCIALEDVSEKLKWENSQRLFSKRLDTVIDSVIQQIYDGAHSVYAAYRGSSLNTREQYKEAMSSLLVSLLNDTQSFFSRKQIKEFEAMILSIDQDDKVKGIDLGMLSTPNFEAHESLLRSKQRDTSRKFFPEPLIIDKPEIHGFQWDRDETNLPSPTPASEGKRLLVEPVEHAKRAGIRKDMENFLPINNNDGNPVYPSVTDAFKAVSSYQQKFSGTALFSGNRLPSPTPSAECEAEYMDCNEEVCSGVENKPGGIPVFCETSTSSQPFVAGKTTPSCHPLLPIFQKEQTVASTVQSVPVISALPGVQLKTRDPMLSKTECDTGAIDLNQFPVPLPDILNKAGLCGSNIISRKHGAVGDALLEGQSVKRPRNGCTEARLCGVVHEVPGRGGWLEENTTPLHFDGETFRSKEAEILTNRTMMIQYKEIAGSNVMRDSALPVCSSGSSELGMPNPSEFQPLGAHIRAPSDAKIPLSDTLLNLLNGINPDVLIEFIKREQERLTSNQSQQFSSEPVLSQPPSPLLLPSVVPAVGVLKVPVQIPTGAIQVMTSDTPKENLGGVCVKPRDPRRRLLQENAIQKTERVPPKLPKLLPLHIQSFQNKKDLPMNQDRVERTEATPLLATPSSLPDISQKFTSALKSVSAIMSVSQVTNLTPGVMSTELLLPKPSAPADTGPINEQVNSRVGTDKTNTEEFQSQDTWGDVDHLLEGLDEQQRNAILKERSRRIEEQNNMFAKRKLSLVLDLDHTLLNSAKFIEVDQVHEDILRKKEDMDRDKAQRHLFRFMHMGMWTKLRPGIWNFLERASKLFELHLYTMGNRVYATEMAKVLDPTGALFAGRVISRGDDGDPFDGDERVPKPKDLDGVLGMESAVLVIDDSIKVWPHHKHNLILVERYTYFPCSRRQFGLFGPSLLEIDHDERPEDGTLATSLAVIERIHQSFFSNSSPSKVDVRDILAFEQRKILHGCRIIFSRIFPVGEANPHLHPLWKLAEQFGATCTNQLDQHVTHVVAFSLGTDKVNWALSTGRFIVNPGWLEASTLLYRRANELDFAIKS